MHLLTNDHSLNAEATVTRDQALTPNPDCYQMPEETSIAFINNMNSFYENSRYNHSFLFQLHLCYESGYWGGIASGSLAQAFQPLTRFKSRERNERGLWTGFG